ncbi:MAG: hypothetical protein P1U82_30510, partial [Verrucomicrobiales bacterium]|nr:hypothetical protein [Verrucomicrobiales bacterium]
SILFANAALITFFYSYILFEGVASNFSNLFEDNDSMTGMLDSMRMIQTTFERVSKTAKVAIGFSIGSILSAAIAFFPRQPRTPNSG